jgi:hypothetical protein
LFLLRRSTIQPPCWHIIASLAGSGDDPKDKGGQGGGIKIHKEGF